MEAIDIAVIEDLVEVQAVEEAAIESLVEKRFSTIDYVLLISILGVSFIIGIMTSLKGNKSPEEFLLGNRNFSPISISMSLLTTIISAVNIVGITTEVYVYGMQLSLMSFGCMAGIAFSIVVVIPVIYPLKLISIHEYIDLRFKSPGLQTFMMVIIVFNAHVWIGLALYATSIALSTVSPISYTVFILAIGSICTIYSTIGGIRAVVYTDVFQFIVMVVGLLIFIIAGFTEVGGVEKLFEIAKHGNRLEFFNMNPSIYERHNFYNTFAFGAFIYGAMFSISQINTQRVCAVATLEHSKLVLKINMFGMCIIHIFLFLGGLVAYAFYAGCDPQLSGFVSKRDEILSFMIVDKLSHIYGLPGVYVATMIASTLSTFSSVLNAIVALIWRDFFCRFPTFANSKPMISAVINKILTLIVGCGFIAMAFVTSKAASIIQLVLSVGGIIFGSVLGIFVLGMCFPKSNWKGAWCGFTGSVLFCSWVCVGNLLYGTKPEELPYSISLCENTTVSNWTLLGGQNTMSNFTDGILFLSSEPSDMNDLSSESSYWMYLFDISYTLYSVIAPLLAIIIGLIVSLLTSDKEAHEVPPELLSPIILRFYGKKYLSKA